MGVPPKHVPVVIIGGGLSGLSSALYFAKHGIDCVVLEARNRVGGRTCSETHNGVQVDVGGAYVGGTQDRILRMADAFGVSTFRVHKSGLNVIEVDSTRYEHEGVIPTLAPLSLLDMNRMLITTEDAAFALPDSFDFTDPKSKAWDSITVDDWVSSTSWDYVSKEAYRSSVRTTLCTHPAEVSMLYWLMYLKSAGGTQLIFDNAQDFKFNGGSQLISDRMAASLGDRVILNSPVSKIAWNPAGSGNTITTRNGTVIRCDYVVIATSPVLYGRLQFDPPLPPLRSQLTQRMPMGCIIKTNVFYEKPWWRESGLSGSLFSNGGPVTYCIDDCKPDGSHPSIMGFVVADYCREWMSKPESARLEAITQQYAKAFKSAEALKPVMYVEKNWTAEEFSGGCYVGVMPPKVLSEMGHLLREPMGTVHFAGTETALKWTGYMDGAVEAGERAAYEIAVKIWEANGAIAASSAASLTSPKVVIPPEAPGVEPENAKIGHPKITSPSPADRLLPSKPAAIIIASFTAAAAVLAAYTKLSGQPLSLKSLSGLVSRLKSKL